MEPSEKQTFGNAGRAFFSAMLPWGCLASAGLFIILVLQFMVSGKQAEDKRIKEEAAANRQEEGANVEVMTITPSKLVDDINLPGLIRPWEELTLLAEVSGKITAIVHDEGSRVKQGEVIARIEARDYRAANAQTKAALTLAKQRYSRVESLRKKGTVSQSELDSVTSSFTQAKAAADTAAHNLERCSIKAPFAGSVDRRYISLGANVTPGSKLFDLLDIHRVKIEIGIPEADVEKIRQLKTATIRVDALGGQTFTAKKRFLSLKPLDQGLIYRLQLELDNSTEALRPGMFVDAHLIKEIKLGAVVLPLSAIIPKGESHHCFIVKDGRAAMRPLRIGILNGRSIEVVSGLALGDQLIIKGQRQLEDGQPINIVGKEQ